MRGATIPRCKILGFMRYTGIDVKNQDCLQDTDDVVI